MVNHHRAIEPKMQKQRFAEIVNCHSNTEYTNFYKSSAINCQTSSGNDLALYDVRLLVVVTVDWAEGPW